MKKITRLIPVLMLVLSMTTACGAGSKWVGTYRTDNLSVAKAEAAEKKAEYERQQAEKEAARAERDANSNTIEKIFNTVGDAFEDAGEGEGSFDVDASIIVETKIVFESDGTCKIYYTTADTGFGGEYVKGTYKVDKDGSRAIVTVTLDSLVSEETFSMNDGYITDEKGNKYYKK